MTTPALDDLLRLIEEVHKFERTEQSLEDFKALFIEVRDKLINAQSELLSSATNPKLKSEVLEIFMNFNSSLGHAITTCNSVMLFSATNPNIGTQLLSTIFISFGNISSIEAFIKLLKKMGLKI